MNKDKKKMLDDVMGQINKTYGKEVLMTGKTALAQGKLTKKVIPTACIELNDSLFCGGWCGIVELFGPQSSGKTSLALDTIAMNQREDPDFLAAWLETEGSVNETILMDHGIDLERFIFIKQEDMGNAESAMDALRGLINRENLVDIIIVNSVAGLSPKKEIEDDLDKQNIALTARMLSKFFRVANGDISKNNIVTVFINQLRDNVGQMFGDPSTTTGGRALPFYASQRTRMNQVKIEASDPIKKEDGVKISFINKKNRFAGKHNPYTKGVYYATYADGIDTVISLPQKLLDAGVLRNKGSWWYYEDSDGNVITLDGIEGKFNSKNKLIETLRKSKVWYDEMTAQVKTYQVQSAEEQAEAEAENEAINAEQAALEREEMKDEFDEMFAAQEGEEQ